MQTFKDGAIRPESAVGKPLVIMYEGEKRQIGTITHAAVRDGKLYFASTVEIEGVAAVMEGTDDDA